MLQDSQVPEIGSLPAHIRRRVLSLARRDGSASGWVRTIVLGESIILLIFFSAPLAAMLWMLVNNLLVAFTSALVAVIAFILLLGLVAAILVLAIRMVIDDPLSIRQRLRELYPTGKITPCIQCGYDLRLISGETCPECGECVYHLNAPAPDEMPRT